MFKRTKPILDMDAYVEERLSDYLDGTLSAEERARVDAHLQTSERARASLQALRYTLSLLKQTPAPALPRQFTLPVTPRAPTRVAPNWLAWSLRGIAVATTAAFVVLFTANILQQQNAPVFDSVLNEVAQPTMIAAIQTEQMPSAAPAAHDASGSAAATEVPPIIMITIEPDTETPFAPPTALAPVPKAQPTKAAAQNQNQLPPPVPPSPTPIVSTFAQPTGAISSNPGAAEGAQTESADAKPTATDDTLTQRTTIAQIVEGFVNVVQLKVREGPGTSYAVIGSLKRGEQVRILGRSEDKVWLVIEYPNNLETGLGWVGSAFVRLNVPIEELPIMPPPPTQTPTPTLTPTATPTFTPIPTDVPEPIEETATPPEPTATPTLESPTPTPEPSISPTAEVKP